MKILRQMGILLGILFVSNILQKVLGIPLPGTVLGMIILLICLLTGIIKVEMVEEVSEFLLGHLIFFFVPAGVSIMLSVDLIKDRLIPILIVVILSTIMVLIVTGLTVQILKRKREAK